MELETLLDHCLHVLPIQHQLVSPASLYTDSIYVITLFYPHDYEYFHYLFVYITIFTVRYCLFDHRHTKLVTLHSGLESHNQSNSYQC